MVDLALRQPDARSCGAAVLVRARMIADPGYDRWLRSAPDPAARFGDEALRTHRRTNRAVASDGRAQLPWPRALGTPPWALARELPVPARVSWVRDRHRAWDQLTRAETPVALYVGQRRLPRHVVLVTGHHRGAVTVYEPASGKTVTVTRDLFVNGTLGVAGWDTPWFVVAPR